MLDHLLSRLSSCGFSSVQAFDDIDGLLVLLFRLRSHLNRVQKVRDCMVETVLGVLELSHLVKTTLVHVEGYILLFAKLSQ